MGFGAESATGVPRWQRPHLGLFSRRAADRPWAWGRALRGFLTTAALVLWALADPSLAQAEPTARFPDAASAPAPPAALAVQVAPAPLSAPSPTPEAIQITSSLPATAHQAGFSRRLAESHLERGQELERRGDIAQALHEYTESIGIDSTLGDAYLRLGALRERTGDPREAELVYTEAMQLADTRARALVQRARLRRAAGLSAQALSDLEAAVDLEPSRAALEELARDYVELCAWSAALAVFRRVAASAAEKDDAPGLETARLEVRALRVLAAETDPSREPTSKHDWVGRALRSIARR